MKHGFLIRILATYSLIVSSVLGIVFVAYYLYAQEETKTRIEESDTAAFMNHVAKNEETLGAFNDIASAVGSLNSIDMFAYGSGDNYFERLTRVYGDLSTISLRLAARDIQVAVHKLNDGTAVSSASSMPVSTLTAEIGIDAATYREILRKLPASPLFGGHYIFTDRQVVYVTSKNYIDVKVIILVLMDASRFKMLLTAPGMATSFILTGSDSTDLRSGGIPATGFPELSSADSTPDLVRFRRGDLTYSWISSRHLNLRYYYAVDDSAAKGRMIVTIMNMLLVFAAACAIAFIVIAIFSIRLFGPIERLIYSFISLGLDEESPKGPKNELDFLARQVLKIRSSNQELVRKVEDGTRLQRSALLHDILGGHFNPDTVRGELQRLSLAWLADECCVVAFELSDSPEDSAGKRPLVPDDVTRLLCDQLRADFRLEILPPRQLSPCFILSRDEPSTMKEKLNSAVSVIDTAFGLRLSAFIGQPSAGVQELQASLATAYRLLDNKNSFSIKSVYDHRDLEGVPESVIVYPINSELRLIGAVEKIDREEVGRILDEIFADYLSRDFDDPERRDMLASALAITLHRSRQKAGIERIPGSGKGRTLFKELRSSGSGSELRRLAADNFNRLFDEVAESRLRKFDHLKENLERYIRDNLGRNISLLDISEHFNLSPNYMSVLFKNALNENFKDYLSRSRFQLAAALLRENPSLKLIDLAERIGITNVNTLIRMFHRYAGVSPGQFVRNSAP